MDIIHLLEVLNPLKNVVTIKIDNDKGLFTTIAEFLIAMAPTLIAVIAMWYSYRQFKISLRSQSEQFRLGLKQQTNALKINTQLATEIELIKDECKVLRETYVGFIDDASSLYSNHLDYKQNSDSTEEYAIERRNKAHENIMVCGNKLMQKRMLIISYLNPEDPEEKKFYDCIFAISSCAFNGDGTGKDLGSLQGEGAKFCFELIKRKRQAILSLAETITD
ncbi:hypothetical protein HV327_07520 [Citrobacter freundii]|uniref:hypothetical protein n=1 Tax=Citrobacter freundii TaxID=546 RepID=UPI0015EA20E2|nr:hypothetical protein [Citrobacter freundii]QLS05450.1 hypothetical protein HV327_07520 [Citrobacter freundii]